MWIQHLFSLVGTAIRIFFDSIGTTLLGRLVDLAFAASVAVAALRSIHRENGLPAMLRHWQENYRAGVKFAVVCALIIYAPVVIWSIGKAVYEDHMGLVARSRNQRSEIAANASILQTTKNDLGGKISDWRAKCSGFEASKDTLTTQNRDQQNTINNCQTQAIQLLAPKELKPQIYKIDEETLGDQVKSGHT